MIRGRRRDGDRQKGQSLTEFALFLPIVIILLLAVGELARVYSTMIAVETAAREATDWGALKPGNWEAVPVLQYPTTITEMERRSCTPTRSLTEYAGDANGATCTNPGFACDLQLPGSATWVACDNPIESQLCRELTGPSTIPCKLRVTLTYTYDMIAPTELLGLPASFTFTRTSIFNIADERSSS